MLYHVSTDTSRVIPIFIPRIPNKNQRMEGENETIPRICVAKSIEDCLTAMPNGGYFLTSEHKPKRIRVYEFDEEVVQEGNLIKPTDLYFSEYVLDAWVTGEYWVVGQNLVPTRVYDIELEKVKVVDAPYVHPDDFKIALKEFDYPESILDELEEQANQSVARVTELKYRIIRDVFIEQ